MQRYVPPRFALTPAASHAQLTTSDNSRTNGIGEADVRHQAFAEKRRDAPAGAVEELIGNDEIERTMLFLERADRAQRDDALHAERFHAVDVGAKVELRGRRAMAASVPRQERDLFPGERAHHIVVRRRAPGRVDHLLLLGFEAGHGIEAAASDDSDFRFVKNLAPVSTR